MPQPSLSAPSPLQGRSLPKWFVGGNSVDRGDSPKHLQRTLTALIVTIRSENPKASSQEQAEFLVRVWRMGPELFASQAEQFSPSLREAFTNVRNSLQLDLLRDDFLVDCITKVLDGNSRALGICRDLRGTARILIHQGQHLAEISAAIGSKTFRQTVRQEEKRSARQRAALEALAPIIRRPVHGASLFEFQTYVRDTILTSSPLLGRKVVWPESHLTSSFRLNIDVDQSTTLDRGDFISDWGFAGSLTKQVCGEHSRSAQYPLFLLDFRIYDALRSIVKGGSAEDAKRAIRVVKQLRVKLKKFGHDFLHHITRDGYFDPAGLPVPPSVASKLRYEGKSFRKLHRSIDQYKLEQGPSIEAWAYAVHRRVWSTMTEQDPAFAASTVRQMISYIQSVSKLSPVIIKNIPSSRMKPGTTDAEINDYFVTIGLRHFLSVFDCAEPILSRPLTAEGSSLTSALESIKLPDFDSEADFFAGITLGPLACNLRRLCVLARLSKSKPSERDFVQVGKLACENESQSPEAKSATSTDYHAIGAAAYALSQVTLWDGENAREVAEAAGKVSSRFLGVATSFHYFASRLASGSRYAAVTGLGPYLDLRVQIGQFPAHLRKRVYYLLSQPSERARIVEARHIDMQDRTPILKRSILCLAKERSEKPSTRMADLNGHMDMALRFLGRYVKEESSGEFGIRTMTPAQKVMFSVISRSSILPFVQLNPDVVWKKLPGPEVVVEKYATALSDLPVDPADLKSFISGYF